MGWAHLSINLCANNLTVNYKDVEVFNQVVEYDPSPGLLVFGGRTGGSNAYHHIDNISIRTNEDVGAGCVVIPPSYVAGQGTIGVRTEDTEQQNPVVGPPELGPGLQQEWYAVGNPGNKDAIDDAFDNNEPIVPPFRAGHGTTWWTGDAAAWGDLVKYPAEVQPPLNASNNDNYIVRATGEIFIPESGDYFFADGVDDYTYFAIDLDKSGVIGDDPIEILIDDNTWTGPLRDTNGGGGGWMDAEIDVDEGGEWLAVEFNMGEGGGGDSGVIYWDYNPNAPEGDRLGGGIGFPDFDMGVLIDDAPDLVIPDTHLRSEARCLGECRPRRFPCHDSADRV